MFFPVFRRIRFTHFQRALLCTILNFSLMPLMWIESIYTWILESNSMFQPRWDQESCIAQHRWCNQCWILPLISIWLIILCVLRNISLVWHFVLSQQFPKICWSSYNQNQETYSLRAKGKSCLFSSSSFGRKLIIFVLLAHFWCFFRYFYHFCSFLILQIELVSKFDWGWFYILIMSQFILPFQSP